MPYCLKSHVAAHFTVIACFQTFASSLREDALRKGYETEVVDLKTYEPEDDLDSEVQLNLS